MSQEYYQTAECNVSLFGATKQLCVVWSVLSMACPSQPSLTEPTLPCGTCSVTGELQPVLRPGPVRLGWLYPLVQRGETFKQLAAVLFTFPTGPLKQWHTFQLSVSWELFFWGNQNLFVQPLPLSNSLHHPAAAGNFPPAAWSWVSGITTSHLSRWPGIWVNALYRGHCLSFSSLAVDVSDLHQNHTELQKDTSLQFQMIMPFLSVFRFTMKLCIVCWLKRMFLGWFETPQIWLIVLFIHF